MRILSVNKGFASAHSSVNYEFIFDGKVPPKAKELVRESRKQCRVRNNIISIHVPGEGYLSSRIEKALLAEYDIPLLIYEDYDWWSFILLFDDNEELFKNLKKYENPNEHSIGVDKVGSKIRLWITVHVNYGAIASDSFGATSPFKPLRELFLEVRNRILMWDFGTLEILYAYCSEGDLSEVQAKYTLEERLKSYLDETW